MTTSLPRARTDVRVIEIGTDRLLYDWSANRLHRLSSGAFLVWSCCDGVSNPRDVADDLAEEFGLDEHDAVLAVETSIAELSGLGMFGVPAPTVRPPEAPESESLSLPLQNSGTRLGPYRAVRTRVWVDCHGPPTAVAFFERTLRSLLEPSAPVSQTMSTISGDDVVLTIWHDDAWHLQSPNGRLEAGDASIALDFLLWEINAAATRRQSDLLILHAAAVSTADGGALVMPAPANSGKSTLATALVAKGFDYLTDESCAIDVAPGEIVAYPKPIALDPGSQAMLQHLRPERPDGRSQKWHVDPNDVRPDSVRHSAVLGHLLFPTVATPTQRSSGQANQLTSISATDAFVAIAQSSLNLADHRSRTVRKTVELVWPETLS
jgi:hypothetical protein